ncbi:hypothetical protein AGR4C_pc30019 [Agrobacterium tumefaciens str. Kerr 14]|uniref:Uncharacterized protein n=2 Tax=Agrobacterium tumefaciens TaxID=358 RepID=A0A4D7Z968_AGRTU|nr:hypothetical protein CFBP7129_29980 [Agrobacterium tumefaciens]CUX68521.1 hypothetical protein AGR4C_pc30019 [Agrobacterium tumefaciens str. Kerr 14]
MVEEQTAASHSLAREAAALFELLEQFTFDDVSRTPIPSSRVVRQPVPATPMRACSGAYANPRIGRACDERSPLGRIPVGRWTETSLFGGQGASLRSEIPTLPSGRPLFVGSLRRMPRRSAFRLEGS